MPSTPRHEQPAPEGSRYPSEAVGANAQSGRRGRNLSQSVVAERMRGLGHRTWRPDTVSQIERGQRGISVDEYVGLALALGMTLHELIQPDGQGWYVGDATADGLPYLPDAYARAVARSELPITFDGGEVSAPITDYDKIAARIYEERQQEGDR